MLFLLLTACTEYALVEKEQEPLTLSLSSPTYGSFLGDGPVNVTGTVSPAIANVTINGQGIRVQQDGTFSADIPFSDRAMVVDVQAHLVDQSQEILVPVFDSVDPRPYDPGAVRARLTPTGLDALEPLVASLVDGLGFADLLSGFLPSLDTSYLDVIPTGVTVAPTTVDLSPGTDDINGAISLNGITVALDVVVLDTWAFPADFTIGSVTGSLGLVPELSTDGMLSVRFTRLALDFSDFNLAIYGIDLPGWIFDYIVEPILDLLTGGLDLVDDLILGALGSFELGGPFAFDLDLMGTSLSAKLATITTDLAGVGMGLTIGIGEPAADTLPDSLTDLPATTPSGINYQLGAAVHEGLFNTLLDGVLADFLNIDLQLEGTYAELIGGAFRNLPGGDQVPEETTGWCLAVQTGDARVVRMVPGDGTVLARGYLPDVQVEVSTMNNTGSCDPWLNATLFATVDLTLDGSAVSADIATPGAWVTYYGAEGVDKEAVASQLGGLISGMVGLLAGSALSFDLGSLELIPGLVLNPDVVEIAPLDTTGLYGVYLNIF